MKLNKPYRRLKWWNTLSKFVWQLELHYISVLSLFLFVKFRVISTNYTFLRIICKRNVLEPSFQDLVRNLLKGSHHYTRFHKKRKFSLKMLHFLVSANQYMHALKMQSVRYTLLWIFLQIQGR